MLKVLLAVDGSENALRATRELIANAELYKEPLYVELLTVRSPLPLGGFSGIVVTREMVDSYYREEGQKALAASEQLLTRAGIAVASHVEVGNLATTIVEHATKSGCRMICMGTRGMAPIPSLVLGSVATKVLHLARMPVLLVP
jgi:nucleotide-binding universal stress UspA family protein